MQDYNTKVPAYYNSPAEEKINVTVEGGGFFKTTVYGRRFFISSTSGEQAFYPAVGYRYGGNGQVFEWCWQRTCFSGALRKRNALMSKYRFLKSPHQHLPSIIHGQPILTF